MLSLYNNIKTVCMVFIGENTFSIIETHFEYQSMNRVHALIPYSAVAVPCIHVTVIFLLKIHSILVIRNKTITSKKKMENLCLDRNVKQTFLFLSHCVKPFSLAPLKKHFKITF